MVAGLNVIVFTIITLLAHREKVQKKRSGELKHASASLDSATGVINDGSEKKSPLVDEEDVTPKLDHKL